MFGTRSLFHKAEEVHEAAKGMEEQSPHVTFLKRLYQQSKQVSQIIAYIWRWADENDETYAEQKRVANLLKAYFEHPTSKDGQRNGKNADYLKELLKADPKNEDDADPKKKDDCDENDPAYLLRQVFFSNGCPPDGYIFPIFNQYELGEKDPRLGYLFEITYSSFIGQILDADNNSPELYKMIIPYPPSPPQGNTNLSKQDLSEWIENRTDNQFFADNPYIPTTCS